MFIFQNTRTIAYSGETSCWVYWDSKWNHQNMCISENSVELSALVVFVRSFQCINWKKGSFFFLIHLHEISNRKKKSSKVPQWDKENNSTTPPQVSTSLKKKVFGLCIPVTRIYFWVVEIMFFAICVCISVFSDDSTLTNYHGCYF